MSARNLPNLRHWNMSVNNLPPSCQTTTVKLLQSNPQPLNHEFNILNLTPPITVRPFHSLCFARKHQN